MTTAVVTAGAEPTSLDLAAALAEAERMHAGALAALKALRGERQQVLIDGDDDTLVEHDKRIDAARRETERKSALVDKLATDCAAAKERELESERRARYERGRAWFDEGCRLLERYGELAAAIAEDQDRLAEIEFAIEAINKDLPAGATPIASVESSARCELTQFRKERLPPREQWFGPGGHPVEAVSADDAISAREKGFKSVTVSETREVAVAGTGWRPVPLRDEIALPGLHRGPPFWPRS